MSGLTVNAYHTDPRRVAQYTASDETVAQYAAEDQLSQGAEYVSVQDSTGKTVMSWGVEPVPTGDHR